MLPIWLLQREDLNDSDIRVLLVLDLMGWREGKRDGVVRESNKVIAKRAGKRVTAVCDSLRRLRKIEPPVIQCDMRTTNTRDAIKLAYDRHGKVIGNPTTVIGNPTTSTPETPGGYRKSDNQVIGNPTTPPIESIERVLLVPVVGEVIGNPTTSPLTLGGLIEWLPCITDDERDLKRLMKRSPLWVDRIEKRCPQHARLASEWVQDALLQSSDKDDLVDYAEKLLKLWVGKGGRPEFELAPKPKADPDETDTVAPAPPYRPTTFAARPTKAERNAEVTAARRASLTKLFAEETSDGPR